MLQRFTITISVLFGAILTSAAQTTSSNLDRVRTYDVQHYRIAVRFEPSKKKIYGDTTVELKPLAENFREVQLDAVGLAFDSVSHDGSDTQLKYRTDGGRITVALDRAYSANETIAIRFKYSAVPGKGIYFIDPEIENGKQVRAAQIWTQGEPDEARHWFPSFDFPSDKATTDEFITAAKGQTVIANGELVEKTDNPEGTTTFHYRMSVPYSTYLVSFVIGDYAHSSENYKNIPLGYYVYPGTEAIIPKAFGKTRDILRVFEELTGVAFPYNKYDQTIVAGFSFGGMENITATTLADTEVFLANYEFGKSTVEDLVSHEAAHSWFGDMVTCKNWAELWLNEGFATFMEAAFREKMYGRESYRLKVNSDAQIFLADDAVNPKRNGLYNRNAGNVAELFDRPGTTYNKGGAVIHTLRETIGDAAFWKGINIYLTRHRFANVESTDLQRAMEESSGTKLGWFFDQWVYGLGSPKLSVARSYNPRTRVLRLTIRQTQQVEKLGPAAYMLPMDVEIKTATGVQNEKIEITKRLETFSIKVDHTPRTVTFDKNDKIPIKTVKMSPMTTVSK